MYSETKASKKLFLIFCAVLLAAGFQTGTAVAQLNQVDAAFQPVPSSIPVPPPNGPSKGQILQPDGKVIVWIGNLAIDGIAKGHIARLNQNGTLDNSFNYCSCHLNSVSNIVSQADGKLLVSGIGLELPFRAKVIRLNPDGSLDLTYNADLPLALRRARSNLVKPSTPEKPPAIIILPSAWTRMSKTPQHPPTIGPNVGSNVPLSRSLARNTLPAPFTDVKFPPIKILPSA